MAMIGMRHVVVVELDSHTAGAEPTYKQTGKVAGKAITGNLTLTHNDNPLYADDAIAEEDNGLNEMSLELGLDDLSEDVQDYIGILKKVTAGTPAVTTYYQNSKAAKAMGVGYIRVRRKGGTTTYQAVIIYKVMFRIENESTTTKGQSIEWQTPTVTGRCMGLDIDSSGEVTYRKIQNFETYSDAESYLNTFASISSNG